jgi:F420H(2)-dependent quinone reductase
VPRPKISIDTAALQHRVVTLHRRLFLNSRGRIGGRIGKLTCLALTTTGRTSGLPRTSVLLFVPDGEDLVLIASNNGSDRAPDWLENIRRDAHVVVMTPDGEFTGTAEVIERDAEGFGRYWRLVNDATSWRYHHYQEKTNRAIPVVVIHRELVAA